MRYYSKIVKCSTLLALITTILLSGCVGNNNSSNSISNSNNNNVVSSSVFSESSNKTEKTENSLREEGSTSKSNPDTSVSAFDLSGFYEHGKWSEGVIWAVTKTENWDSGSSYTFAYYDEDGKKLSEDYSYGKGHLNKDSYMSLQLYPNDMKNGYAIIDVEAPYNGVYYQFEDIIVYNKDFSSKKFMYCRDKSYRISSDGNLYVIGSVDDHEIVNDAGKRRLYRISNKTEELDILEFEIQPEGYENIYYEYNYGYRFDNIKGIEKIYQDPDSAVYFISFVGAYNSIVLDDDGLILADFDDIFNHRVVDILDVEIKKEMVDFGDHQVQVSTYIFEIVFMGGDWEKYKCRIDTVGNILSEPEKL